MARTASDVADPHVTPTARLAHRGGLPHPLRPDGTLIHRFGGPAAVARFVNALYDRIAADPELVPIFAHHVHQGRGRVTDFFVEWMGGERGYSTEYSKGQQRAHFRAMVTSRGAGRWLTHVHAALSECRTPADVAGEVLGLLGPMARGLVNEERDDAEPLSACHKVNRLRAFWRMAEKGDLKTLQTVLRERPELVRTRWEDGRTLLWQASRAGRGEIVRFLIDAGADLDAPGLTHPSYALTRPAETLVMTTPYCVAVLREHRPAATMLLEAGAAVDVFTCALLGDLDGVAAILDEDGSLAATTDPAEDVFPVTPLHHALCGKHRHVVEYLLGRGVEVTDHSVGLLTIAVRRNAMDFARLLVEHGAHADGCRKLLGEVARAGRTDWAELLMSNGASAEGVIVDGRTIVEYTRVAEVLLQHGARAGELVRLCNGNNGNQGDHPEYVRAVLEHGADVRERDRIGRTALHTAAKSGFLDYIPILLEFGARVDALDDRGDTPIDTAQPKCREAVKELFAAHAAKG